MKFVLKIDLGNAAMASYTDVALALHALAVEMAEMGHESFLPRESSAIRDDNGNPVGGWWVRAR